MYMGNKEVSGYVAIPYGSQGYITQPTANGAWVIFEDVPFRKKVEGGIIMQEVEKTGWFPWEELGRLV